MRKLGYATTLGSELLRFARQHKVYWLIPLVLILMLAALVIFGSQTAAPFIYQLS